MSLYFQEIKLSFDTPIPLYYQIKQQIIDGIEQGSLKVQECLPTELELVTQLKVSRSTVRQAMNELVNEGYVLRKKGCGTYVTKPKIQENFFQQLDSFNVEMQNKGLTPSTKVLHCHMVEAIPSINEKLQLPLTQKLLYLARVRYANNSPIVFLETYLPYEQFQNLEKVDFTEESLYESLEKNYQTRVNRAVRHIEAVAASSKESKLLGIQNKDPLLLVKSVGYAAEMIAVEYSVARYVGENNTFTVELRRE